MRSALLQLLLCLQDGQARKAETLLIAHGRSKVTRVGHEATLQKGTIGCAHTYTGPATFLVHAALQNASVDSSAHLPHALSLVRPLNASSKAD